MGVSTTQKDELAAFQLKDMDQTLYNKLKDSWALKGDHVTLEIFKKAFFHRFFPGDQRIIR